MVSEQQDPVGARPSDVTEADMYARSGDKRIIIKGGSLSITTPFRLVERPQADGTWLYTVGPEEPNGHVPFVTVCSGTQCWTITNLNLPEIRVIYRQP